MGKKMVPINREDLARDVHSISMSMAQSIEELAMKAFDSLTDKERDAFRFKNDGTVFVSESNHYYIAKVLCLYAVQHKARFESWYASQSMIDAKLLQKLKKITETRGV